MSVRSLGSCRKTPKTKDSYSEPLSSGQGAVNPKKSGTPLAKILLFARKIPEKSVKILSF